VAGAITVEVVACPRTLLTDDFSGTAVDTAKWTLDPTSLEAGVATPESAVTLANGQVKMDVTAESPLWAGFALNTAQSFSASVTKPVTFEIDRAKLEFVLTTGTGAEQRTGIWVKDATGNSLFFNDYVAHDGRNFGWRVNSVTGQATDDLVGAGVNILAFDGGTFDDRGSHRMKIVVNGATAKLFLDGILGAEVPFPFSQGLTFGFGTYVDEAGNVSRGYFDNALLTGDEEACPTPTTPSQLTVALQAGNLLISWTGAGTLQETDGLPGGWRNVTPAPTGTSHTVAIGPGQKYYRLTQP
jgi:hypothetical protein